MEDRVDGAGLDDLAEIHDGHRVGHLGDHAHVVGDEDDGQVALALDAADEVEDLRLRRHVERGRRLVGDQERRLADQRHRDHRALPQAALQLERIHLERTHGVG
ncbi:MAG: hypothetical protein ACKOUS_17600, partial [Alphaproteobacteria bacterium]